MVTCFERFPIFNLEFLDYSYYNFSYNCLVFFGGIGVMKKGIVEYLQVMGYLELLV